MGGEIPVGKRCSSHCHLPRKIFLSALVSVKDSHAFLLQDAWPDYAGRAVGMGVEDAGTIQETKTFSLLSA